MFDWQRFLDAHNVPHVTAGANVGRGDVGVNCPFCRAAGDPDPSEHMVISLAGKGWVCRRDHEHRGKNPTRLVQALLNCSMAEALAITGMGELLPDDFAAQVRELLRADEKPAGLEPGGKLKLPREFYQFHNGSFYVSEPFFKYLNKRGYTHDTILNFSKDYGIYYATRGAFANRIIFTVRHLGELVSWTGRGIYARSTPRYLTLTTDAEAARRSGLKPARGPLPNFLLWHDQLRETDAHTLYVVEGPFDALRIAVLGKKHGIASTCLFTSNYTESQRAALFDLLPKFRHRYLMLDREVRMLPISLKLESDLASLGVRTKVLPPAVADPAELTEAQLLAL